LKYLITKYLIFLQVLRVSLVLHNGGSMTNAKVCQGFHDDKKVEEHCINIPLQLKIMLVSSSF